MSDMDLSEFLLARISDDEAATRKLQRRAQDVRLTLKDPNLLGRFIPGWHDWPDVEALTVRVLAECAAKRRIVDLHSECGTGTGYCDDGGHGWDWPGGGGCATLALLALPYTDHADYDPAWRPEETAHQ